MKKIAEGAEVVWRELDPSYVPGEGDPRWIEHPATVRRHGRDAGGIYTEIELVDGRVVRVHRDSLRAARTAACPHPEHRLGTHGRLRARQRVCLQCGAIVAAPRQQRRKSARGVKFRTRSRT